MPAIKLYDCSGHQYTIKAAYNQKVIYIHRGKTIDFKLNLQAMSELSSDAYLLYMYLMIRQKDKVWALSSKEVFESTALKKRTYMKAVAELIDKQFLIPGPIEGVDKNLCTYHLWESHKAWGST